LGTINHSLLTVVAAKKLRPGSIRVVLMDCGDRYESTGTNFDILRALLAPIAIVEYPFLGQTPASLGSFRRHKKILQKVLAPVLE